MAYWAATTNLLEARFLAAILNSEIIRRRIAPMQLRGQGGARHFDKLVWELRIPRFDPREDLHRALAAAASKAEGLAAAVPLNEGSHFTRRRRAIRDALAEAGISAEIDRLVSRLLDSPVRV